MDPLQQGVYEQYIDSKLEYSEIVKIKCIVDELGLPISSEEDISIGFLIGSIISQLDSHFMKNYFNPQKKKEIENYLDILRRRSSEIKSEFNSFLDQHVENLETTTEMKERLLEKNRPEENSSIIRMRSSEIKSMLRSWVNRHVVRLKTAVSHTRKEEEITAEKETYTPYPKTPEESNINPEKKVKFDYDSVIQNKSTRKMMATSSKKKKTRTRTLRLSPLLEEV